jgi:hypothetical protein
MSAAESQSTKPLTNMCPTAIQEDEDVGLHHDSAPGESNRSFCLKWNNL